MWRSKLHPQTSFSLVQFTEERSPPMELPLLDHSSPVLCILFLSGDTTCKKTSLTDYQHVSKNYCHRKIPKDWRRSLQDNECIQPPDSDLVWFQCLTCCPCPPTDSRYCSAVLKLLQGYLIQGVVLSHQVGFSSSSCCDEQRFENPILLLENPPSNIRKTSHPLDRWTHTNLSRIMKASQRRMA